MSSTGETRRPLNDNDPFRPLPNCILHSVLQSSSCTGSMLYRIYSMSCRTSCSCNCRGTSGMDFLLFGTSDHPTSLFTVSLYTKYAPHHDECDSSPLSQLLPPLLSMILIQIHGRIMKMMMIVLGAN